MKLLANRKTVEPEAEGTAPRIITAAPLLAAALLFIVGLWGLVIVSPYSPPSPFDPLFVVRPASPPAVQPPPDAAAWMQERGLSVAAVAATAEPNLDEPLVAEDEQESEAPAQPEPTAPVVAAANVGGAGGAPSPVGQVNQALPPTATPVPPTPTATPEPEAPAAPPPTLTPTPTPADEPPPPDTATPTPEVAPAVSRPIAAFFDPNLQQPTPASSYDADSSHPVHQAPQ